MCVRVYSFESMRNAAQHRTANGAYDADTHAPTPTDVHTHTQFIRTVLSSLQFNFTEIVLVSAEPGRPTYKLSAYESTCVYMCERV